MRTNPALDFTTIKRQVLIEQVLEREGSLSTLRKTPTGLVGCCPIHKGNNKQQFRFDTGKQLFRCFSPKCGAGGDVISLVQHLYRVRPEQAAALLVEWFALTPPLAPRRKTMAQDCEQACNFDPCSGVIGAQF
jgi:DNA primase